MISVRHNTYHGREGWTISGHQPEYVGGRYVRIFTDKEAEAAYIANAVKHGLPWHFGGHLEGQS